MQSRPAGPRRSSALRRYGPIVAVVAVIAIVVAVFGATSGGGGNNKKSDTVSASSSKGPVTFDKSLKVDWGPNCDTTTGKVKIPSIYAPPCVEPFHGNNGGATAPGVTGDTITIAVYVAQNDPLQAAFVTGAGANITPDTNADQEIDFAKLYAAHYELYGRKVNFVKYHATGGPADETAAKADAIKIATDIKPFAVFGGPPETSAFADQLAADKIICTGNCAATYPTSFVKARQPYLWEFGPLTDQAAALSGEMIGKQLGGKKAVHGGDAVKDKTRVFGILHYDTPDGQYSELFHNVEDALAKYHVKAATDVSYPLDLNRASEIARTAIAKLKSAGVTSVIIMGDPIMPKNFTDEATKQGYFPEWILGPNVYIDTAIFGRTYDQKQWIHAFGPSFLAARGEQQTVDAYNLYVWQYGRKPPSNIYSVTNYDPSIVFAGLHLAGPDLTPETFRDGLFRAPVAGGGPTTPTVSRGKHGLWPGTDLGGIDDATEIWWNPNASGVDEVGHNGTGLWAYVDGGKRYRLGHFPSEDPGLFDPNGAVTIYKTLPASDTPPSYPSPAG
ncbi:MAG TPA: hypothetical protein VFW74_09690 [Acidimicrobiia bacterium]|nr:hypothetical protein [Acidimicrobiia bacterium]